MSTMKDFWIGDTVTLSDTAVKSDKSSISNTKKGSRNNWIVTDLDIDKETVFLGKRRVLGGTVGESPALEVPVRFVNIVSECCRHPNQEYIPGSYPTCTSPRILPGRRCKDCGLVLQEPTVDSAVGAYGHMFEYDYDNNKRTCMRCKLEESVEPKNVIIKRSDIETLIAIVDRMIDENAQALPDFSGYCDFDPSIYNHIKTNAYSWSTVSTEGFDGRLFTSEYTLASSTFQKNMRLPLVIWLHDDRYVGKGELISTESDATYQFTNYTAFNWAMSSSKPAYFLFPHLNAKKWIEMKQEFFDLIEHVCSHNPIDRNRIVIGGHQSGATGALFYFYQDPDFFSSLILVDGENPSVDTVSLQDRASSMKLFSSKSTGYMYELAKQMNCDSIKEIENIESPGFNLFTEVNLENLLTTSSSVQKPGKGSRRFVTHTKLPVWTQPKTYSPVVDGRYVLFGHELTFVEIEEHQNYTWGKISPETWKYEGTETGQVVTDIECWLPLEYTSEELDLSENVLVCPCDFDYVGENFGPYKYRGSTFMHNGVDLIAPFGSPVYLAGNKQMIVTDITDTEVDGLSITFQDPQTNTELHYMHIKLAESFTNGAELDLQSLVNSTKLYSPGCLIGNISDPVGKLTPNPHLHFGVKVDGAWIDPKDYISTT